MGSLSHAPGSANPGQDPLADPTDLLPSSPSQTYLNLLVLEANLRSQYLNLRARRRKNAFVITVLMGWIAYFVYAQWLRPREDGTGVGGSVYWLVDAAEKVALIGGVVMAFLFWMTGQWERGVRWPRRWLSVTNRGLRIFNCKLVVIPRPWWRELLSSFYFIIPFTFFVTPGLDYQPVEARLLDSLNQGNRQSHTRSGSTTHATLRARSSVASIGQRPSSSSSSRNHVIEEDLAPGGDYVKLVLLPKPFTPDFREKWELFRADFWVQENERRAQLRKAVAARQRELARQTRQSRGWFASLFRHAPSTAPPPSRRSGYRSGGELGSRPSSASSGHSRQSSTIRSVTKPSTRRRRKNSNASAASSVSGIAPPATPIVTAAEDDSGVGGMGSSGYSSSAYPMSLSGSFRSPSSEARKRTWSNSTAGSVSSVGFSVSSMQSRRRRPTTPLVEVQSVNSGSPSPAQSPATSPDVSQLGVKCKPDECPSSKCDCASFDQAGAAGGNGVGGRLHPDGLILDGNRNPKVVYRRTSLLSMASSAVGTDVSSTEEEQRRGKGRY